MPIEVELGVPLRNSSSQSDYSQSFYKAIQLANQVAQRNLVVARKRQSMQYDQGHPSWKPLKLDKLYGQHGLGSGRLGRSGLGPTKSAAKMG